MKIPIKTNQEIESMRKGGKILAKTLDIVLENAKAGISTFELDQIAENYIRSQGAIPGFKGFQGFPGTLCTCINDTIVHGVPRKDEILKEGDLFTIDCGVKLEGLYTDAARSIGIGQVSPIKERLLATAKKALKLATETAKPGVKVNQISKVIQKTVEKAGFHIIHDLTGHGVGKELHEAPTIFNYYVKKQSITLAPGMTIAIEPIFSVSSNKMYTLGDNWTIKTSDHSDAVQEENTILITQNGSETLTLT